MLVFAFNFMQFRRLNVLMKSIMHDYSAKIRKIYL